MRGKPITHNGLTMNVSQWARHLGISKVTLGARLGRYGMSLDRALQSESYALRDGVHYKVVKTNVREHRVVAEKALGKPLPPGAVVHHVDEDRRNNDPSNLVICPSNAYHLMLHARMNAYAACGHYDWRKCVYCKEWGDPSSMKITKNRNAHHPKCHNEYHLNLRRSKKQ